MTVQKKTPSLPYPKVGDLVSLPNAQTDTLCLVLMDDFKDGQVSGVFYLPVRVLSKPGKNVLDECRYLSKKDLDDIRQATRGKAKFMLDTGGDGKPYKYFRVDYDVKHYAFDEDKLPEIFFLKYATTLNTNLFKRSMEVVNRKLLAQGGVSLEIEETNRPALQRKPPPSVREQHRPSKATSTRYIDDLSLEDAKKWKFINAHALKAFAGVTLSDGKPLTLKAAYDLVTSSDARQYRSILGEAFSKVSPAVTQEIISGWQEFTTQLKNPKNFDFTGITTRYPERRLDAK